MPRVRIPTIVYPPAQALGHVEGSVAEVAELFRGRDDAPSLPFAIEEVLR